MAVDVSAVTGFNPVVSLISALNPVSRVTAATSLGSLVALTSTQTTISNLGFLLNASESLATAAGKLAAPDAFAAPDAEPARAAGAFVNAFNAVQAGLLGLGRDNPTLGVGAFFLRSQLAGTLDSGPAGNAADLARLGITANADGSLSFDAQAFEAALASDPEGTARVFRNDGEGVAEKVAALTAGPLSPASLLQTAAPTFIAPAAAAATLQAGLVSSLLGSPGATDDFSGLVGLADQFLLAQILLSRTSNQATGGQGDDFLFALLAARSQTPAQNLSGLL